MHCPPSITVLMSVSSLTWVFGFRLNEISDLKRIKNKQPCPASLLICFGTIGVQKRVSHLWRRLNLNSSSWRLTWANIRTSLVFSHPVSRAVPHHSLQDMICAPHPGEFTQNWLTLHLHVIELDVWVLNHIAHGT